MSITFHQLHKQKTKMVFSLLGLILEQQAWSMILRHGNHEFQHVPKENTVYWFTKRESPNGEMKSYITEKYTYNPFNLENTSDNSSLEEGEILPHSYSEKTTFNMDKFNDLISTHGPLLQLFANNRYKFGLKDHDVALYQQNFQAIKNTGRPDFARTTIIKLMDESPYRSVLFAALSMDALEPIHKKN
ncbi:hypothetical protein IPH25_02855 [bacterium]|nr:MAG: hypothetical protein IPG37_04995 [bacterium]QQR61406.1 MAG: hypothetical protein IPH25_02855 [bacterium]QQR63072.1 MAG: hypothetical protein IPH67_01180 [bacterium]